MFLSGENEHKIPLLDRFFFTRCHHNHSRALNNIVEMLKGMGVV
jgi:hypothetical protein